MINRWLATLGIAALGSFGGLGNPASLAEAARMTAGSPLRERVSEVDSAFVERLNEKGQVVELIGPDGGVRRFGYDGAGQLSWREEADRTITTYRYDSGRLSVVGKQSSQTHYLYDGDGGTLAIVRAPDETFDSRMMTGLQNLANKRSRELHEHPRVLTDDAGRPVAATNGLVSERFRYGKSSPIDVDRTFDGGSWAFEVARRQTGPNSLTITDSGNARFSLTYRRGFDQVERIAQDGAILLDRMFDSSGRLAAEVFGNRIRVDYDFEGSATMWIRKTFTDLASGRRIGEMRADSSAISAFSLAGKPSPGALESASELIDPYGAEIRGPLTQAVGFVRDQRLSWYVYALDGPYAILDASGRPRKRVFTVQALGTPFSSDRIEVDDQYLRLVLDSPTNGGRTVLEIPSAGNDPGHKSGAVHVEEAIGGGGCDYSCTTVEAGGGSWTHCYVVACFGDPGSGGGGPGGGGSVGGGTGAPVNHVSAKRLDVNLGINQAKSRLGKADCAALFNTYKVTGSEVINQTTYWDGEGRVAPNGVVPCGVGGTGAWTTIGGHDVYICNAFNTTVPGWVTIIHEALHEAGKDETPSSAAINALVQSKC